ncbi:hypothetical protein F5Y17DRAFT_201920 [Xylariaceae sp. FL0594]|nr:hypothetical protein F5Y17DRAFT_201920 [Xylariaceae sp. FL0594]
MMSSICKRSKMDHRRANLFDYALATQTWVYCNARQPASLIHPCRALTMTLGSEADLAASAPSKTAPSDFEGSADFSSSVSVGNAEKERSVLIDYIGYEGIEWNRLPEFSIRHHRRRPRTGWVWEHGFDIEKHGSGHRFWLCKTCHLKKATVTYLYNAASTSQANAHMEEVHRIGRDGPMPP